MRIALATEVIALLLSHDHFIFLVISASWIIETEV